MDNVFELLNADGWWNIFVRDFGLIFCDQKKQLYARFPSAASHCHLLFQITQSNDPLT